MKILVTGGAGYIGSIASEQLCKAGYEVVVFDSIYQGHRAAVPSEADFVEGDLSDRMAIDLTLAEHRPDAVMHFAAFSLVGESMQKPFRYLAENVANSTNLLQSMMEHGVNEVVETARGITGHPIPVQFGARRSGDPAVLVAASDKIRHELGWKPRFPQLHDIIESAWRWHQAHPHGYGDRPRPNSG